MGNRQKLSHHEELTRQPVTMKNQFTEKKLLRHKLSSSQEQIVLKPGSAIYFSELIPYEQSATTSGRQDRL
jgi:hypothetical protein